jgi:hypothetical protein
VPLLSCWGILNPVGVYGFDITPIRQYPPHRTAPQTFDPPLFSAFSLSFGLVSIVRVVDRISSSVSGCIRCSLVALYACSSYLLLAVACRISILHLSSPHSYCRFLRGSFGEQFTEICLGLKRINHGFMDSRVAFETCSELVSLHLAC